MMPEEIRNAIRKIRSLTQRPFNVNLFITDEQPLNVNITAIKAILAPIWHELTDLLPIIDPSMLYCFGSIPKTLCCILMRQESDFRVFNFCDQNDIVPPWDLREGKLFKLFHGL